MLDDEHPRPKPASGVARDLKPLSVDDLVAYTTELKAEMARVEAEIGKRRDVRGAAEAAFKPRAGQAG